MHIVYYIIPATVTVAVDPGWLETVRIRSYRCAGCGDDGLTLRGAAVAAFVLIKRLVPERLW